MVSKAQLTAIRIESVSVHRARVETPRLDTNQGSLTRTRRAASAHSSLPCIANRSAPFEQFFHWSKSQPNGEIYCAPFELHEFVICSVFYDWLSPLRAPVFL